jgi:hypothetical protein
MSGEAEELARRIAEAAADSNADDATHIEQTTPDRSNGPADPFKTGETPKASEIDAWARAQGWTKQEKADGAVIEYRDKNGIVRIKMKKPSPRTPGSEHPRVEIRNADGERVDPSGKPVSKTSPANHTPIIWDLP